MMQIQESIHMSAFDFPQFLSFDPRFDWESDPRPKSQEKEKQSPSFCRETARAGWKGNSFKEDQ